MLRLSAKSRTWFAAATLLGLASGCLVVAPLDELRQAPASNGDGGSDGGTAAQGGSAPVNKAGNAPAAAGENNPPGDCKTHADCAKGGGGEPYICRASDHQCIVAKNEFCPVVQGQGWNDPNAIYLGAFANLNAIAPENNPIILAQQLALEDLNVQGGLPDAPDGTRRPLLLVVCDNDPKSVDPALDHLIDELELPGLVATIRPGDFLQGFGDHRSALYFCPTTVTDAIAYEKDDDLIWSLLGESSDFAPAYAKLLERTETYVRATHHIAAGAPIRVALVTTLDASDADLNTAIQPLLRFNGMSLKDNIDADNFEGFTVESSKDVDRVVEDLVTFRPDIVVSAAGQVITSATGLLWKTEDRWENSSIDGFKKPLPTYLLSPNNQGDLANVALLLQDLAENTPEENPENRFFGLMVGDDPDRTLINAYQIHLDTRFMGAAYEDTANYYDAVFFLAYATYAAGTDEPLSGSSLLRGMKRLQSGETFAPGLRDAARIFSALSEPDATINLKSTLGPPGFDPETRVRHIQGSTFCFRPQGSKMIPDTDVKRYDPTLKDFTGSKEFCFGGLMP